MSPLANVITFGLGLTHLTFDLDPRDFDIWSGKFWSSQTARQTESDAYEPNVHTHRWAQK